MPPFPQSLTATQRVTLALWLIVLTATVAVRSPLKSLAQLRETDGRDQISAGIARFTALKPFLQSSDSVGYLRDSPGGAQGLPPEDGRRALAQQALLPLIVERTTDTTLVIFDADNTQAEPAQARLNGWTLVFDAGNGVRLYRTSGGS